MVFEGYVQKITPGFLGEKRQDLYMKITDALYIYSNGSKKKLLETILFNSLDFSVKSENNGCYQIKIYLIDDNTYYFQILANNEKILEIRNYLLFDQMNSK